MKLAKIEKVTRNKLKKWDKEKKGIMVVRCAGHEDHSFAWIEAINKTLLEEEIIENEIQPEECFTIHVCEDRDDLVMVYDSDRVACDICKLAMWRLRANGWGWSVTWLEDYLVNDRNDFKKGK